jgi:integrase
MDDRTSCRLLTALAEHDLLVRFDAYTGLRSGELAAVRVGRLDLLRGTCEVVESATEVAGGWRPTKWCKWRARVPLVMADVRRSW